MNGKTTRLLRKTCNGCTVGQWRQKKREFVALNWIERAKLLNSIRKEHE